MMTRIGNYLMLATVIVLIFSSGADAISRRSSRFSLAQRTQIELRLGVRQDTHSGDDYYYDDALLWRQRSEDLVVTLGLNYWVDETTAFSLAVKALAFSDDDGFYDFGVYDYEYSVVPIFLGFRKYLGEAGTASAVRPYVALSGGPVIGAERVALIGFENVSETHTQAAAGAYFGGGVDFLAGRHFTLGMNVGYNLLSDFDDPVNGQVNYSGAEFGVGFGFVF